MWAHDLGDHQALWIQGRTETLLRHLKNCSHQPEDIRNLARDECVAKQLNDSLMRSSHRRNYEEMCKDEIL